VENPGGLGLQTKSFAGFAQHATLNVKLERRKADSLATCDSHLPPSERPEVADIIAISRK
jgi:hypothetical protein